MEYNKIISVTGMSGLFELVGNKADGAIVRSLEDNSTKFASSRSHQFSHLESIEIYTIRENVNLVDIFNAMKNSNEKLPDYKNNAAVKKYFEKAYPDMDFDRVYASDMKKMVRWYEILTDKNIAFEISAAPEEAVTEAAEPAAEEKTPAKKSTKKSEAKPATENTAEKSKKKSAPKKTDK